MSYGRASLGLSLTSATRQSTFRYPGTSPLFVHRFYAFVSFNLALHWTCTCVRPGRSGLNAYKGKIRGKHILKLET
jgi:hypothetical protein